MVRAMTFGVQGKHAVFASFLPKYGFGPPGRPPSPVPATSQDSGLGDPPRAVSRVLGSGFQDPGIAVPGPSQDPGKSVSSTLGIATFQGSRIAGLGLSPHLPNQLGGRFPGSQE